MPFEEKLWAVPHLKALSGGLETLSGHGHDSTFTHHNTLEHYAFCLKNMFHRPCSSFCHRHCFSFCQKLTFSFMHTFILHVNNWWTDLKWSFWQILLFLTYFLTDFLYLTRAKSTRGLDSIKEVFIGHITDFC